jgi:hypothetical protein
MDISLLRGSHNRIFSGSGQDVIYAGTSDVIPGGSGHDAIWALDNDTFIIGSPYNRGLGGVGNDKLSIIEGVGGNYLNGGSCTEQLCGGGPFHRHQRRQPQQSGQLCGILVSPVSWATCRECLSPRQQ